MRRALLLVLAAALLIPVSREAAAAPAAVGAHQALPLAGVTIAIDPGHNGGNSSHLSEVNRKVWIGTQWKVCNTTGTATNAGFPEHRFTWKLAHQLKKRLVALGATVRMTRTSDTGWGPCSTQRGRFGAKVHADLTISLHGDGLPSAHHGFAINEPGYVKGYTDDIRKRSHRFALALKQGLIADGMRPSTAFGGSGIVSRTDLGTLNLSDVPVVLLEVGNMRSSIDARIMTSPTRRDRVAHGIVRGIRGFLHR